MHVVSIKKSLDKIEDYWNPLIIGELNDQLVKAVKVKGRFVMHHHDNEDEMFMVVKGRLTIEFEETRKEIGEGEFIIIPRGVSHKPIADDDVHIILFEPKTTLNTGNIESERTVHAPQRLNGE